MTATERTYLTAAQERELATRAKAGDRDARIAVLMNVHRLVFREAGKMATRKYADADELAQVGMLKVVETFDSSFDPSLGYRLSTYVMRGVIQEMNRAAEGNNVIRVPTHNGSIEMDDTKLLKAKARDVLSLSWQASPTDAPIDVADDLPSAESVCIRKEQLSRLREAASVLGRRERYVVMSRMNDETLISIARSLRLSKERVRQIQVAAMAKLRAAMECER